MKHQLFTADVDIKSWLKVLNKQCFTCRLPASVRDKDNFLVFKRTIKSYLFRKAFACYS